MFDVEKAIKEYKYVKPNDSLNPDCASVEVIITMHGPFCSALWGGTYQTKRDITCYELNAHYAMFVTTSCSFNTHRLLRTLQYYVTGNITTHT